MQKIFLLFIIMISFVVALFSQQSFEYRGVDVKVRDQKGYKTVLVKRERAPKCKELLKKQNNTMLWSGGYAASDVPSECKKSFMVTAGKLQPMVMDEDIETYGELEVLSFIKEMQHDKSKVLIDVRKEPWFTYRTIPGAVNMPFYYFRDREHYKDEFAYAMQYLGGVKDEEGEYEFKNPKTIVVFCNGPWCSLSSEFIKALMEVDFPAENIKWFRGGIQAWLLANMTSTRP